MNPAKTHTKVTVTTRLLAVAEFQRPSKVPPEVEWVKNIRNTSTKRRRDIFTNSPATRTGTNAPSFE